MVAVIPSPVPQGQKIVVSIAWVLHGIARYVMWGYLLYYIIVVIFIIVIVVVLIVILVIYCYYCSSYIYILIYMCEAWMPKRYTGHPGCAASLRLPFLYRDGYLKKVRLVTALQTYCDHFSPLGNVIVFFAPWESHMLLVGPHFRLETTPPLAAVHQQTHG